MPTKTIEHAAQIPDTPRPGVWHPILDYATAAKFLGKTVRRCYGMPSPGHHTWQITKCENMNPGWIVYDEEDGYFAMGGRTDDTYADTVYFMVVPEESH